MTDWHFFTELPSQRSKAGDLSHFLLNKCRNTLLHTALNFLSCFLPFIEIIVNRNKTVRKLSNMFPEICWKRIYVIVVKHKIFQIFRMASHAYDLFNNSHKERIVWKHGPSTNKSVCWLEIYRTALNTGDHFSKIMKNSMLQG